MGPILDRMMLLIKPDTKTNVDVMSAHRRLIRAHYDGDVTWDQGVQCNVYVTRNLCMYDADRCRVYKCTYCHQDCVYGYRRSLLIHGLSVSGSGIIYQEVSCDSYFVWPLRRFKIYELF